MKTAIPQALYQHALSTCFAGGELRFEKMNFVERAIIKRIAKADKSVSQIREDEIDKLVMDYKD
jgi:menaquinone-dependent protoporphyrinogen oxidase